MRSTRWLVTYVVAASVGLWLALFLSLKFVTPAHSQSTVESPPSPTASPDQNPPPPDEGDLPPEFLEESNEMLPPPPPAPQPPGQPVGEIPPPPVTPPMVAPEAPSEDLEGPKTADQIPPMEDQPTLVIPQFAADDQYTYDSTGLRDPFKPYRTYRPAPVIQGNGGLVEITDPLQRWDLNRFGVVAIMWEVRNPRAMVRDPDGKLYMIARSTKIGRNSGEVVAIREGEVVVVENIENEGVQTREVKILELKK